MKDRNNYVAKHMLKFNKAAKFVDRRKEERAGHQKHKKRICGDDP
jgi:hypothetical protein